MAIQMAIVEPAKNALKDILGGDFSFGGSGGAAAMSFIFSVSVMSG